VGHGHFEFGRTAIQELAINGGAASPGQTQAIALFMRLALSIGIVATIQENAVGGRAASSFQIGAFRVIGTLRFPFWTIKRDVLQRFVFKTAV
jgi:hypothetical protein